MRTLPKKLFFKISKNLVYIDCDKGPETFFSTPHSQEFMVSRIFFVVVLIFLDPLMGEFTLMEVF